MGYLEEENAVEDEDEDEEEVKTVTTTIRYLNPLKVLKKRREGVREICWMVKHTGNDKEIKSYMRDIKNLTSLTRLYLYFP